MGKLVKVCIVYVILRLEKFSEIRYIYIVEVHKIIYILHYPHQEMLDFNYIIWNKRPPSVETLLDCRTDSCLLCLCNCCRFQAKATKFWFSFFLLVVCLIYVCTIFGLEMCTAKPIWKYLVLFQVLILKWVSGNQMYKYGFQNVCKWVTHIMLSIFHNKLKKKLLAEHIKRATSKRTVIISYFWLLLVSF